MRVQQHLVTTYAIGGEFAETGTVRCTCRWSEEANVEYLDALGQEHLRQVSE